MDGNILVNIKSLLAPKTHGLSVLQIKKEYSDLLGANLPVSNEQLVQMLAKCPGVTTSYSMYNQQTVYHYNSPQTAHISNMNKSSQALKQKIFRPPVNKLQRPRYVPPFRRQPTFQSQPPPPMQTISENGQTQNQNKVAEREMPARLEEKPRIEDFTKTPEVPVVNGNGLYRQEAAEPPPAPAYQEELQPIQESVKEGYEPTAIDDPSCGSIAAHYHKYTSNFCGRELIGDDFFLSCFEAELAHQQLFATARPQIGFCISGLTIADALAIVDERHAFLYQVIINLGSTDLLLGNTVERMGQSYRQLVNILQSKGANPIVTTLAPLANNDSTLESKLKQFNRFLKSMFSNAVDLEMAMRQLGSGRPDSSLYDGSCPVNGVPKWSRKGMRRILMTLFTYTADCGATTISSTEKEVTINWHASLQR